MTAIAPTTRLRTIDTTAAALCVGDVVLEHGGLFRIDEKHLGAPRATDDTCGRVFWTRTTFLGAAIALGHDECRIPEHMRETWNVQGNALRRVTLVVPEGR